MHALNRAFLGAGLLLLAFVAVGAAGDLYEAAVAHGTFGLDTEWRPGSGGRALTVVAVEPGGPAARAGIVPGDRIATRRLGFENRVAITLQGNLRSGNYLALGQRATFSILRDGPASAPITLRADPSPPSRSVWLYELRIAVYLLVVIVAGALMSARPSIITWSFALFVIFGQMPGSETLQLVGMTGSPVTFFIALVLLDALLAAAMLGLIVFATRFPEERAHPAWYASVERIAFAFVGVNVALLIESYFGHAYGWPALDEGVLLTENAVVTSIVAIALLARTWLVSTGVDRKRLAWAIVGPSLGTIFSVADTWLNDMTGVIDFYPVLLGLLSSLAPFSMMYAILRYRVIDIRVALNFMVADAVAHAAAGSSSTGSKDRRDLVRRTALLLSTDIPLRDLYGQLASLLAHFVDASSVMVIVGDKNRARVEYLFEDGAGGRPDDQTVTPGGASQRVLDNGKPILFRTNEDFPKRVLVSIGGRVTRPSGSGIFVPIVFGGSIVGALSVQSRVDAAYDDEDVALLETCALYLGARIHDAEVSAAGAEMRALATSDALTGVANRRAFDDALASRWGMASVSGAPVAILLLDVDFFKAFNDTYGHVAGDACLRHVAQTIAACVKRPSDLAARYGGEEFAAILFECDDANAARIAEQICAAVRSLEIPHQGSSLGYVTVSAGVASSIPNPDDGPGKLLSRADERLYEAKDAGRNRVAAEGHRSDAPEARRRVVVRHNLPMPRTTFVGRHDELARLGEALAQHHLVTVVGPGGCGKTRLAIELALRAVENYPDGVWFVDLASVTHEESVAHAVAAVLLPGREGPVTPDRLAQALRDKQLLVVFDNCEHLVAACARLVDAMLVVAEGAHVLTTSREPLALGGEFVHRLSALDNDDGIRLFLDRARASIARELPARERETVARIVDHLEGIPLAIELAAARLVVLSTDELLERLSDRFGVLLSKNRDAPTRQLTLQALLDWSYQLLSEAERAVFRRLAVFAGGWTSSAAIAVCSDDAISPGATIDALEGLVAKSLVLRDDGPDGSRLRFLESTREYAAAALDDSGDRAAVDGRHLKNYARYARTLRGERTTLPYGQWSRQQTLELDNYCVALRTAYAQNAFNDASLVLESLGGLVLDSEAFFEFVPMLRSALARKNLTRKTQATFLLALAQLLRLRQPVESLDAATRAYDLFRRSGGDLDAAYAAWFFAGAQLRAHGAVRPDIEPMLLEALETGRKHRDRHLTVGLLRNLAYLRSESGRNEEARAALRDAVEVVDRTDVAMLTSLLGSSALEEFRAGNVDNAIGLWRQAASLSEESRPSYASLCFTNVGLGELTRGDSMSARVMLRKGLAGLRTAGHNYGIAVTLDHFARLAVNSGDPKRATRIAGFSQSAFEKRSRASLEQRLFDELVGDLRHELGPDDFEHEWNRGSSMNLEDAIDEAYTA